MKPGAIHGHQIIIPIYIFIDALVAHILKRYDSNIHRTGQAHTDGTLALPCSLYLDLCCVLNALTIKRRTSTTGLPPDTVWRKRITNNKSQMARRRFPTEACGSALHIGRLDFNGFWLKFGQTDAVVLNILKIRLLIWTQHKAKC